MALTAFALSALTMAAHASPIIVNGSFESTTNGGGQIGFNTAVTGWSVPSGATSSYAFVFTPGSADHGGVINEYGPIGLWGPGNGSNNGLPASSPDGGNFVALDGAFQVGALSQTVNGLTAGNTYTVSFYYAGAQQNTFAGATTEGFQVSLGGETLATPILSDPSEGFTGWQTESLDFTADSTTDTLSFLAVGTPSGEPPFTLLDGVSITPDASPTPEPSSVVLVLTGILSISGVVRARFKK
jgi:hypothetical protein